MHIPISPSPRALFSYLSLSFLVKFYSLSGLQTSNPLTHPASNLSTKKFSNKSLNTPRTNFASHLLHDLVRIWQLLGHLPRKHVGASLHLRLRKRYIRIYTPVNILFSVGKAITTGVVFHPASFCYPFEHRGLV